MRKLFILLLGLTACSSTHSPVRCLAMHTDTVVGVDGEGFARPGEVNFICDKTEAPPQ